MIMKVVWFGIIGILVLGLAAYLCFYFFFVHGGENQRIQLLYGVDHEALLQACRDLSMRVKAGSLKPGDYAVRLDSAPEVATFPKLLVDLNPSAILVGSDGVICIAMAGGLDHFGVVAFPEDYEIPNRPDSTSEAKELLPGLWYYDDGYREFKEMGKDYNKHVEALRPRAH
jgi:hypothetical protein